MHNLQGGTWAIYPIIISRKGWDGIYILKGEQKKRPHETLTNDKYYFLTTPEYFPDNNIELIQNILFIGVEKK